MASAAVSTVPAAAVEAFSADVSTAYSDPGAAYDDEAVTCAAENSSFLLYQQILMLQLMLMQLMLS